MEKILAVFGMFLCIVITYMFSKEKKSIQWKSVLIAFLGQILLAFILIKTPLWKGVEFIANGFTWVINQSTEGINFVFGGITSNFVFFYKLSSSYSVFKCIDGTFISF